MLLLQMVNAKDKIKVYLLQFQIVINSTVDVTDEVIEEYVDAIYNIENE